NASGQLLTRNARADSLWRGRLWYSWRSDVSVDTARAVRVNGAGLAAELMTLAGAEDGENGWTGWTRSPEALMGAWSWSATAEDTLTSPAVDLGGRTRVWLQLWNKYRGSVYQPAHRDRGVRSWPLGATAARVGIYTFAGARLMSATVAPRTNEFVWDLNAGGRRVVNGAYLVVVQVGGRVSRQRLFVTRSGR